MCMQCVGIVGTAFQAATLVGGPIVVKHYQRIRAAFGLPDNSVAAVEARAMESAAHLVPAPEPATTQRRPPARVAGPDAGEGRGARRLIRPAGVVGSAG